MTDELSPLDDDIASLLGSARDDTSIPRGAHDRVAARLSTTLGFPVAATLGAASLAEAASAAVDPVAQAAPSVVDGASTLVAAAKPLAAAATVKTASALGVGAAATTTTATATTTVLAALAKPVVIGSFVAGTLFGGGTATLVERTVVPHEAPAERGAARAPTVAPAPEPEAAAVVEPAVDVAPELVAPDAPRPAARPTKAKPVKASRDDDRDASDPAAARALARERSYLEMARTALSRGDAREAKASLEKHRAQFPTGKLSEERDALLVLALVGNGETSEAERLAARFERTYPKSLLLPTVKSALAR